VYHSTLGLRVIKKKKKVREKGVREKEVWGSRVQGVRDIIFIELMTSDRTLKASREGLKWGVESTT